MPVVLFGSVWKGLIRSFFRRDVKGGCFPNPGVKDERSCRGRIAFARVLPRPVQLAPPPLPAVPRPTPPVGYVFLGSIAFSKMASYIFFTMSFVTHISLAMLSGNAFIFYGRNHLPKIAWPTCRTQAHLPNRVCQTQAK